MFTKPELKVNLIVSEAIMELGVGDYVEEEEM